MTVLQKQMMLTKQQIEINIRQSFHRNYSVLPTEIVWHFPEFSVM